MLAWLMAGHLIGDYLLQNKWMAVNKTVKPTVLLVHSAVYTAAVWLVSLGAGGLNWPCALLIFVGHVLLDNRKFVSWWCKYVTQSEPSQNLAMITDQTWHIVILLLACLLKGVLSGGAA